MNTDEVEILSSVEILAVTSLQLVWINIMKRTIQVAGTLLFGVILGLNGTLTYGQDPADSPPDRPSVRRPGTQRPDRPGFQPRRNAAGGNSELKVGAIAPEFKLKSLDGETETELTTLRNANPVVLFFGSYT